MSKKEKDKKRKHKAGNDSANESKKNRKGKGHVNSRIEFCGCFKRG